MVYRELRETCSKLGEEMFSKSAEAGSKGTNYFSCHKDFTIFPLPYSFLSTAVERKEYGSGKIVKSLWQEK